jgi:phage shock protein C
MNATSDHTKQLVRTHNGRMIAGVCSGAGEHFGIDPNLLRVALGVFALLGGSAVMLYIAGWLLIPEEGVETSILQDLINRWQRKTP